MSVPASAGAGACGYLAIASDTASPGSLATTVQLSFLVSDGIAVSMNFASNLVLIPLGLPPSDTVLYSTLFTITPGKCLFCRAMDNSTVAINSNAVSAMAPYTLGNDYIAFTDDGGHRFLFGLFNNSAATYFIEFLFPDNSGNAMLPGTGQSPTPVVPVFLGCYADYKYVKGSMQMGSPSYLRAFPNMVHIAKNSVAACRAVAFAHESLFFGMEAGVECWYGDSSTSMAHVTALGRRPGACTVPCPGDATNTTKCGAKGWAISVFRIPY
ncbi:MAG: hypothetical protein WDW36_001909 [Sanguina aurantia]